MQKFQMVMVAITMVFSAFAEGDALTVDQNGKIGIGTSTPAGRLEVVNSTGGAIAENYLQVTGSLLDNDNYPGLVLKGGTLATAYPDVTLSNGGLLLSLRGGASENYPTRMGLTLSSNTQENAFAAINSGSRQVLRIGANGALLISGSTENNSNYPTVSLKGGTLATTYPQIALGNGGLNLELYGGSSTTYGSRMSLHLNSNSQNSAYVAIKENTTELMRVNASGNMGLGTNAPEAKLHVYGTNPSLWVQSNNGGAVGFIKATAGQKVDMGATNNVPVGIHTNGAERITIKTDGNVGIGTTNPKSKLTVNGHTRVLGIQIRLDNSTYTSLNYNVNEGGFGGCALVMCSSHFNTGNGSRAAVYMIRAGYNGNNFQAYFISGNNIFKFKQVNGILHAGGWDGSIGAVTIGLAQIISMGN